jgi:YVTN family beta-propeller protein/VCBS repeat-containing protein
MRHTATGYSSYVGRIGALAIALGIGVAIATPAGVAWASPADSDSPSGTSTDPGSGASANTTSTAETSAGGGQYGSSTAEEKSESAESGATTAPGVVVSTSGGADSATNTVDDSDAAKVASKPRKSSIERQARRKASTAAANAHSTSRATGQSTRAAQAADSAPAGPAANPTEHVADSIATAGTPKTMSATSTSPLVASTTSPVRTQQPQLTAVVSPINAVLNAVEPILSSFFGAIPGGPTESPLAWVFLAAARRQLGLTEESTEPTSTVAGARTTTALTSAVTADAPPSVAPTFGTPDPVTGMVTGALNASDPEDQTLTYAVTSQPASGTLVFNSATATFTYTPTTSQRVAAGVTTVDDTIAMTVTVTDGTNTLPAVVNIPVSPASITKAADVTVNDPAQVVATNNRVYVTNKSAGTVTVIDTTTNTVVGTINVGATPDGVVLKPDGSRLYVSSTDGNTVTVVNTTNNTVVATIAVAKPSAMAINSSGSIVYVANYDAGTVTKIATSTNAVSGTAVTLPVGSHPTEITVSPDKTKIYVLSVMSNGSTGVSAFALSSSSATAITSLSGTATGVAVSPDNSRVYVTTNNGTNSTVTVINSSTKAVVGSYAVSGVLAGITVSNDGSTLVVNDNKGKISTIDSATGATLSTLSTRSVTTTMSQLPAMAMSPDGTKVYLTDYDLDRLRVVSLAASSPGGGPTNHAPVIGDPTFGSPNATTGAVAGAVIASDPDGDPLTYTLNGATTKGSLVFNANGTFTYTPTAAARHAASTVGGSTALKTDSFTVTVSDGRQGTATATITVNISPTNSAPTVKVTTGIPSSTTGQVKAQVSGTDADKDPLTFTASTPAKGTVVIANGIYTYTPTAAARHVAAKVGATTADKTDTFTITSNDGHGGTATVSVTVTVVGANAVPDGATAAVTTTNNNTGTVTGVVAAVDPDGDNLTVTSTAPTKGVLTINANGTFTYTPTAAARQAASVAGAPASAKIDTVTFTVADGYGGKDTVVFSLPVTPYAVGNPPPTNAHADVNDPTLAIGQVTGTVTATDPGDTLTYTLGTGPTRGTVKVAATGAFTYVPTVSARYLAKASTGIDRDTFTVTVTDSAGNTTTANVSVEIAPPDAATSAIDQRGTTVAMNVQEMLFYSQADTDKALDLLKADGVDTIRILIPWAQVEPTNDAFTGWAAVDRMVNSATARDMEVLGVLNSTPTWAGVPGGVPLAAAPADPQEFAEFAGVVAARYAGKIGAYEIWNEPNGFQFWSPTPNAAAYTAILKAAYPVIKAADPNAVVVAAGLGAVITFGNLTIDPVTFLQQMYASGAAGYFDALSYHPYLYTKLFSTPSPYPTAPINQVEALHDLMVANGDGSKKIWATEYGQPAGIVSEQNQADYIGDFLRAWRDLDYAGPAFIHTIRDYDSSSANTSTFGVYHNDWTPKPAVGVIEDVIDENEAIIAAEENL